VGVHGPAGASGQVKGGSARAVLPLRFSAWPTPRSRHLTPRRTGCRAWPTAGLPWHGRYGGADRRSPPPPNRLQQRQSAARAGSHGPAWPTGSN